MNKFCSLHPAVQILREAQKASPLIHVRTNITRDLGPSPSSANAFCVRKRFKIVEALSLGILALHPSSS